jgi:hypothetical protein
VAYLLRAGTGKPKKQPLLLNGSETTFISRQQLQTKSLHTTVEALLEMGFYMVVHAKGF